MKELRYEGYWATTEQNSSKENLPWPKASDWPKAKRKQFLFDLRNLELKSKTMAYKGYSTCRICGCVNGNAEYVYGKWSWPAGLAHYIADHGIRPSKDFRNFVQKESS